MRDEILELEKNFFKLKYMTDKEWLDNILSDDFTECGKSGVLFNKDDTIEALTKCQKDRDITIYNFDVSSLGDGVFLAHYITVNDDGQKYFRTSVWSDRNGLKLFFHQASRLSVEINLVQS